VCPNTRSSYDEMRVLIRLDVRSVHIICFGRFSTVSLILSTISRLIPSFPPSVSLSLPDFCWTDIRMREPPNQHGLDCSSTDDRE
jgi:hypothetical protein